MADDRKRNDLRVRVRLTWTIASWLAAWLPGALAAADPPPAATGTPPTAAGTPPAATDTPPAAAGTPPAATVAGTPPASTAAGTPPAATIAGTPPATTAAGTPPASAAAPQALSPPGAALPSCPDSPGDRSRSGMLEVGGSFGLLIASGVRDVAVTASLGRFVADNVELSAVAGVGNVKAADRSATVWSTLVEPSYHLPLGPTSWGVLGMGAGVAYVRALGTALAIAPRIGASFAVGRSGIVTTALSYQYITHSALESRTQAAVVAITGALRLEFGYAVRW